MAKCDYCQHVEMCGWRESLEERGCDFFDDGNKWIPISKRLPEDFQRVLVTVVNYSGNKVVRVAEYDNYKGVFRIKENHESWEVGEKGLLAWVSLPEPYVPDINDGKMSEIPTDSEPQEGEVEE